jgi:hypothetical protein
MATDGRSTSISAKITEAERGKLAAFCAANKVDVSTLIRTLVLREIEGDAKPEVVGSEEAEVSAIGLRQEGFIQAWIATTEEGIRAGLEGRQLTVERFREICSEARNRVGKAGTKAGARVVRQAMPVEDIPAESYRETG